MVQSRETLVTLGTQDIGQRLVLSVPEMKVILSVPEMKVIPETRRAH